jgi:hypothetical protein
MTESWTQAEARISAQIAQLDVAYAQVLKRSNGAVTVADPQHRSLGIHRLIQNYYRPSPGEQEQLRILESRRGDVDQELGKLCYKPGIDDDCFANFFHCMNESTVQKYDFFMAMDNIFREQLNIHGIGKSEFMVGSSSIFVDERPVPGSMRVHPVGAIDGMRFNRQTQKLCLLEVKSPEFGENFSKTISMRSLHLKQKVAKQLTFYAWLFFEMAAECGIGFNPSNVELYIVIGNRGRKQVAVWRMDYSPQTFLGGVWESRHWHAFISPDPAQNHLFRAAPPCSRCRQRPASVRSATDPNTLLCPACITCAGGCGKNGRVMDKNQRYFCSEDCFKKYYSVKK